MHWIIRMVGNLLDENPVSIKHIHDQTSLDAITLTWACVLLVEAGLAKRDCVGRVSLLHANSLHGLLAS